MRHTMVKVIPCHTMRHTMVKVIPCHTMRLDFQFYYLLLILFLTLMLYNGIFVFCRQIGDLHPPTIVFIFAPDSSYSRASFAKLLQATDTFT